MAPAPICGRGLAFRRGLALLLAAQPVLWMSGPTYAQSLQDLQQPQPPSSAGATGTPPPGGAPGSLDPFAGELFRQDRAPGTAGAVPAPGSVLPGEPEPARPEARLPVPEPRAGALDEPVDPQRYTCGPGDVFELNFWGVQNFKARVTVDVEGRAFVPRLGYFAVEGRTLAEVRQLVRSSVARYYPRLSFDLALAEPRTFLVQVADAVARPGSYPVRATERVAVAIARAGGPALRGSERRIEVRRRDGTVVTADLRRFALTGDVRHNPYLRDGDVVHVPYEELVVLVDGAVNRPGRYELVGTRDLAELLELAGGVAPGATALLPVTVARRGDDDRRTLQRATLAEGGRPPALGLKDGDLVHVPTAAELQQSVVIVGAIAGATLDERAVRAEGARAAGARSTAPEESTSTRRVPFVEGDTVRTLLERVGGVGPLADLRGAYLLRGGAAVPVDLEALVMLRDLRADRPVQIGDTLVVPFKRRNVVVDGAVFAPGSYPFNPSYRVEQYLALAGGRTRNAQGLDEVTVSSPDGRTQPYQPDLRVEPGSTVVVPERSFSRPELVGLLVSTVGLILTGVAVVISASK